MLKIKSAAIGPLYIRPIKKNSKCSIKSTIKLNNDTDRTSCSRTSTNQLVAHITIVNKTPKTEKGYSHFVQLPTTSFHFVTNEGFIPLSVFGIGRIRTFNEQLRMIYNHVPNH